MKKDYLEEGAMADTADLVVLGAYYGTGNKGKMTSDCNGNYTVLVNFSDILIQMFVICTVKLSLQLNLTECITLYCKNCISVLSYILNCTYSANYRR